MKAVAFKLIKIVSFIVIFYSRIEMYSNKFSSKIINFSKS